MTNEQQITDRLNLATLIDQAISACDEHMKAHRRAGFRTIVVMILMLAGLTFTIYEVSTNGLSSRTSLVEIGLFSGVPTDNAKAIDAALAATTQRQTVTTYVLLGLSVLVFGVLMAVYRFHLQEIAKAEHYKIGFLRIKIAAANGSQGFKSEVMQALAFNAFDYSKVSPTKGKIESPLPGHPTSDIATLFINKVFETFELKAEPKQKE